jgi:hypothetical protein
MTDRNGVFVGDFTMIEKRIQIPLRYLVFFQKLFDI